VPWPWTWPLHAPWGAEPSWDHTALELSESSGPTPLLRDIGNGSTDVAGRPMSPKNMGLYSPANALPLDGSLRSWFVRVAGFPGAA
jgi:hypothetical protein